MTEAVDPKKVVKTMKWKGKKYHITEADLETVGIGFNGKEIPGPAGFGTDFIGLEIGRLWAERQKKQAKTEA